MMDGSFLQQLIRTTLQGTPFPLQARSVVLLLGTTAVESHFRNIPQAGGGVAKGLFQIEPATARDLDKGLRASPQFKDLLSTRAGVEQYDVAQLLPNIVYQILLARYLYYSRDPEKMPGALDVKEQAVRWKRFYNTPKGKGTEQQYIEAWHRLVEPLLKKS